MYSVSNVNAKFLVAAQQGDTHRLKKLLDDRANVNTTSPHNESALHLAARNNHLDAVKFLVNAGIDVTLRNTNNLTATQIAYSENNEDIGNLLDLISLAYAAEKFAANMYEAPNNFRDLIEYRENWKKKFNNLQPLIISNIQDIYKNKSQADITESTIYALRLAELFVATKVAIDMKQRKGLCAEMSRASYLYLLKKIKGEDLSNIVQIGITFMADPNISHSFNILNLHPNAKLDDLTTWGNAIVCDSSHYRIGPSVYFVQHAPENSAIALIKKKTFYISKPFERRPTLQDEVATSLNEYWNNWILRISNLYPNDVDEPQECLSNCSVPNLN